MNRWFTNDVRFVKKRRLLSPADLCLISVLLTACSTSQPSSTPAPVTATLASTVQTQPTTAPAVPTAPSPAAQPTTTLESIRNQRQAAPVGSLAFHDKTGFGDEAVLLLSGLQPPLNGVYVAWLEGESQTPRNAGAIQLGADGSARLTYDAPDRSNLLATYSAVQITDEQEATPAEPSTEVVYQGSLPPKALIHLRHVLVSFDTTPNKVGFAVGLRQQADEVLRHAQFLRDALDAKNLALVKVHAEHLINIIEGQKGAHYGDSNKDGKVQNPGDGFGLLENGDQVGYLKGAAGHAKLAADAPDATDNIRLHAPHVSITAGNATTWLADLRDRALQVSAAANLTAAEPNGREIVAIADRVVNGVDANGDEAISPIAGEGGVRTAYAHAQYQAIIPIIPVATATVPAPGTAVSVSGPATSATTVEMKDFEFVPKTITVQVGTTILWKNTGQQPHTATSDTGIWDTGTKKSGESNQFTFTQPGTFPYFCQLHGLPGGQGMAGTVIVQGGPPSGAQPGAGTVVPTP